MDIPSGFYRTSIKGLILDKDKRFLLAKEDNGLWELPGGAIEFNEAPDECLKREIKEEMGLNVIKVGKYPMYFLVFENSVHRWTTNVIYEIEVMDLKFISSDECTEIDFFDKTTASSLQLYPSVTAFVKEYDPNRH